jgi:DNA-binding winged helix-turn-helix (wHTH) protein/tetratricopeptide (TPR) repeat protein
MLKSADLVSRSDFRAGPLFVSPGRRLVQGPDGSANLEPVVMKVLIVLLDARGAVVTREELFEKAWGGALVGDDSLNRAVARVRKILADTAPGSSELETIPRTGYRLTGAVSAQVDSSGENPSDERRSTLSRRLLLGSATAAGIAGLAGIGFWSKRSKDRQFDELLQRGVEALEYGDGTLVSANILEDAVAIRPTDAAAQGLLAYALMVNISNIHKGAPGGGVERAEQAVNTALRLDPGEPNARLAQIELRRTTLDLAGTEDALRRVLATAPRNIFAMRLLWNLLQSAGRSREALALVRQAIAIKPLAAANNFPFAQLLWIVGQTAEADRVIDRAMEYWPDHRVVRFARFTIFTYTGRARTALAMLDNDRTRPQVFSPASMALWRVSLKALDNPSAANVAATRATTLEATNKDPLLSSQSILCMSALGDVDTAFKIANNLLQFLAPATRQGAEIEGKPRASSTAWRFTPWLFTPPAAPMRADPRFAALADGIGLSAYWRTRNVRPDYQVDS